MASLALRWTLTVVFAGLGGYCALRCTPRLSGNASRRWSGTLSDAAHAAMSAAMIAMLWAPEPADRWVVLMVVFATAAGWYLVRAGLGGELRYRVGLLHQAVAMIAMCWMLLTMSGALDASTMDMSADMPGMDMSGGAMAGMSHSTQLPATVRIVTLALAGYLAVAALWWMRAGAVLASARGGRGAAVARGAGEPGTVAVGGPGRGTRMLRTAFGPMGEMACQTLMAGATCVALLIPM